MYEAERWHSDERFYTPMIVLDSGVRPFIKDTIKIKDCENVYGKVEKFAIEVNKVIYNTYINSQKITAK